MINAPRYMCTRAAVFSDIHSNYYALKACVEDAKAQGADGFVFLGDYISGLADPERTLDLVYEIQFCYQTICIRGNRERYMLEHRNGVTPLVPGSHTGSLLFTYNRLREKDIAFFEQLPISAVVEINGVSMEIAHATMENDRHYFEKGDQRIPDVFRQMKTTYLLTGHSHKQYCCHSNDKTIINPGSVGLPQGKGWHSQYALLDITDKNVICTFRQVAYDMVAAIHEQFQSGLIEHGRYWALSDLYGAIEGKEYTKELLTMIYRCTKDPRTALCDEAVWHEYAVELNLGLTEEAALKRFRETCYQ